MLRNLLSFIFRSLVAPLQEQGRYDEAYHLSKTYGQNPKDSLQCLIKGKLFLKAISEAQMQQGSDDNKTQDEGDDLITLVSNELLAYQSVLLNSITGDEELFKQHKDRLIQVRANRLKLAQFGGGDDDQVDIDECDLLSDTTSMRSSRYTASSRGTG